jgi:hypothetical protein
VLNVVAYLYEKGRVHVDVLRRLSYDEINMLGNVQGNTIGSTTTSDA